MSTEIKIGSTVTAPVTDKDGEMAYVIGKLISINSRYAKVEVDGTQYNIGKSKIELAKPAKKTKKGAKKSSNESDDEGNRIAGEYDYKPSIAASGRTSCDNGDKTADALRGKTIDEQQLGSVLA